MAKKPTVKFDLGDSPKPRVNGGAVSIRAAIPFTVKKDSSFLFRSGVSCSHPVAIVGGRTPPENKIVPAGEPITVVLKNPGEDELYDIGDTVITVIPLGVTDIDVV